MQTVKSILLLLFKQDPQVFKERCAVLDDVNVGRKRQEEETLQWE